MNNSEVYVIPLQVCQVIYYTKVIKCIIVKMVIFVMNEQNKPMLIAKREYPYHRWEPLYFGTNSDPWYNEILSWEGIQDKMAQMLELCLQGYRMVILDGGFLCHAARDMQEVTMNKMRHRAAWKFNLKRYIKIIESFKLTYPDRSQCRIDYGLSKS